MCLRHVDRLGSHGALQVHHVVEIQNGGEDTKENIWVVCTSCHKLIHHQRTYLNNHFKGTYTISDLEKDMEHDNVPENVKERLRLLFAKNRSANNA
jgi:5-methylcytosine-specific restriction endonuclease McrA